MRKFMMANQFWIVMVLRTLENVAIELRACVSLDGGASRLSAEYDPPMNLDTICQNSDVV